MKKQFHLCHKEKVLQPKYIEPIKNYTAKPRGGIWTSTYDAIYGSDWIQWKLDEGYNEQDLDVTGYILTPKPDVNLYVVDCFDDCLQLMQDYLYIPIGFEALIEELRPKVEEHQLHMFYGVDYEKLKEEGYDGLHLTRNGFIDCHIQVGECNTSMFNGFDCECTIWFHWCFEQMEYKELTAKKKEIWNIYEIARKIREENKQ